jgi:hypothetical protein
VLQPRSNELSRKAEHLPPSNMVATRRSGPVSDLSAGKSPSEPNEESIEGQEEPRKLRGRRLSTGIVESGKRSASPAEQPEVTSLKRQKASLSCFSYPGRGSCQCMKDCII